MKIIFRVDSSKKIGSGHLMRCLSISDLLIDEGAQVLFISCSNKGNFNSLVKEKGIPHKVIKNKLEKNLDNGEIEDANETIRLIKDQSLDMIIIDHYSLGVRWERALKPYTKKIFVIDDLANREHDCDFLLDQNFVLNHEDRYRNKVPKKCNLFLGPQYALLQKDYDSFKVRIRTRVKRLLIFFGGHDNQCLSLVTLKCVLAMKLSNLYIDIVISSEDNSVDTMKKISKNNPKIFFHHNLPSLSALINKSDLAIGAGGISLWERCLLGLPAIVITVSDNQIESCKALSKVGAIKLLGHFDEFSEKVFVSALKKLISSKKELSLISKNAYDVMKEWSYNSVSNNILNEFR